MKSTRIFTISGIILLAALGGCATGISGTVRLVDMNNLPVTDGDAEGIVVNMINTSVPLEEASFAVKTDKNGKFNSDGAKLKNGTYKVEAGKSGFLTTTVTVEVKGGEEVNLDLKQIPKKQSRTFRSSGYDQDKIVNPGEVNIQPPAM